MKPHHYIILALTAALAVVALVNEVFTWVLVGFFAGFAVAEVHCYICEVAEAKYLNDMERK
jgi:hypothetical protein